MNELSPGYRECTSWLGMIKRFRIFIIFPGKTECSGVSVEQTISFNQS